MAIIRVAKRARWTAVSRECVNDARLSFRARGVLVYLLDKPDDWTADAESIAKDGKEGRDAIRAALKELTECGYLLRTQYRTEGGTWATEQTLYEQPMDMGSEASEDTTVAGNQRRSTSDGQPATDSQGLTEVLVTRTDTEDTSASPDGSAVVSLFPTATAPAAAPPKSGRKGSKGKAQDALPGVDFGKPSPGEGGGDPYWAEFWTADIPRPQGPRENGKWAKGITDLKAIEGITPADVGRAITRAKRTWSSNIPITPMSVAGNWSQLHRPERQMSEGRRQRAESLIGDHDLGMAERVSFGPPPKWEAGK